MIASCGCRVKSYRAKMADGVWFCPACYSEYVNSVEFYKSTVRLFDGFYYTFVSYKNDGKICRLAFKGLTKEIAEAKALELLPEGLKEKFNES